jgi:hypothetical protein
MKSVSNFQVKVTKSNTKVYQSIQYFLKNNQVQKLANFLSKFIYYIEYNKIDLEKQWASSCRTGCAFLKYDGSSPDIFVYPAVRWSCYKLVVFSKTIVEEFAID